MNSPFALGKYTAAALHLRPRPEAPMISQLLLGEPVRKLERAGAYYRVRRAEDGLEGYVQADQLLTVSEQLHELQCHTPCFALDLFGNMLGANHGIPVTFGARLPDYDGLQTSVGNYKYLYSGQAVHSADVRPDPDLLIRLARKWRFCPELTGGRTPTGIDPVGLIQLLMRLVKVYLPYDLDTMTGEGRPVDFIVQCQAGDLAFFDDGKGRVGHLGLVIPGGELLHVRGRVRIDGLDHFGIFDRDHRRYTHRLRIVRRWLPDRADQPIELSRSLMDIKTNARQTALF